MIEMEGYLQLGLMLLGSGLFSGIFLEIIMNKKITKNLIPTGMVITVVYFYTVCIIRTVSGQGSSFLGGSFAGKDIRAYLKVMFLEVVIFAVLLIFVKCLKKQFIRFLERSCGLFAAEYLLTVTFYDLPRLYLICIEGMIAGLLSLLLTILEEKNIVKKLETEHLTGKRKYLLTALSVAALCVSIFLAGPTELYAYNIGEFAFTYQDFMWYLVIFSILLTAVMTILLGKYLKGFLFDIVVLLVFSDTILSYLQSMFLNGKLESLEGLKQTWGKGSMIFNILLWLVLILAITVLGLRHKKGMTVCMFAAAYIIAVQTVAMGYTLLTTDTLHAKKHQLVVDDMFTLSSKQNVVVFILDAYDVQMLKIVQNEDSSFLDPMKDFTYYDNMSSRFYYTDKSLPYLLTGIKADFETMEETEYQQTLYQGSHFLDDIKSAGYDLRILTETKYVQPFEDNPVDNYTDLFYCHLDAGKTVSQMGKCTRYKTAPFLQKQVYAYESYDITNLRTDTNLYLFGSDADFYDKLEEQGITTDDDWNGSFRMYHLFGAHCPYYLTENVEQDFSSGDPMAQWRASLKIVYRYLDELKEKGLYDSTTVIVTADHGLNNTQTVALKNLGIHTENQSNPIFFIKRADETHEALITKSEKVSHEDFFPTIIKSIDSSDSDYGKAIWEK